MVREVGKQLYVYISGSLQCGRNVDSNTYDYSRKKIPKEMAGEKELRGLTSSKIVLGLYG